MLLEGLYQIDRFNYTESTVNATVKLNKDHEIFNGHFPGNPVLPGVCTMQIIKELTERALDKNLLLSVSSNIKFMALINPEKTPVLDLEIKVSEEVDVIKIKNTTSFGDTIALKLSAQYTLAQ
ncbi:MAG: 3-hydroxyacyl-ACP dehydratase [Flavobacteriaceae bacterium]|nr:3-hydroxyacyl-ACP dehydratase [Flavobacteriaceae bacterium]